MATTELILTDEHKYYYGDIPVAGVTETLGRVFGERPWWTKRAAEVGTALHKACYYEAMYPGGVDDNTLDPEIKNKVTGFRRFLAEGQYSVIEAEKRLFSPKYYFAGTLDLILSDQNDRLILPDIKSSYDPVADLQLGGYAILWDEIYQKKISEACALVLYPNGKYQPKWLKSIPKAKNDFLGVLTVSNWKFNNNYLIKGD